MVFLEHVDPTESQLLRDKAIVDDIMSAYVKPLLLELDETVSYYSGLSDREKYVALLRLNEASAPRGQWLTMAFGALLDGSLDGGINGGIWDASAAFFAGDATGDFFGLEDMGGTRAFRPCALYPNMEGFGSFPLPFRVAVVADLLARNTSLSFVSACRLAAGFDTVDNARFDRVDVRPLVADDNQRFGWNITIRDTLPTNDLLLSVAAEIREGVKSNIRDKDEGNEDESKAYFYAGLDGDGKPIPLYSSEDEAQIRAFRDSASTLVEFVDNYLPSKGVQVGKRGKTGYKSWDDAAEMFAEMFPSFKYSNGTVMRNAYNGAKKRREGR